ncbi:MAG: T9SS C-terminal target domain-containing protein [Ignavibacteriae bacterium]|nr:MAG: T9SS C-terminal target domain-containing protein [Ignavibacteriota bacterium]
MKLSARVLTVFFLCSFLFTVGSANQYFVATTGVDTNPGTIDLPFLTLAKAVGLATLLPGDTIYIRGGTYLLGSTVSISKIGVKDTLYHLFAYPGEQPVFNFSAQTSSDGIKVNGKYWHLRGLESCYAAHNGIAINGSYNIIENCSVHDNRNSGMQLGNGASNNRIINCDSYYNFDPPSGGNADGFSPKLDVGTGNYFYGCRSWQNSDDGWDGYLRPSDSVYTTIENCWSFMNGYLKSGSPIATGNGNGFKMGGGDNSNSLQLRHYMTLKNCLSFDNRVKGFDQNNDRGTMILYNCTGYRNGTYNFSVPGPVRTGETLIIKNCISMASSGVTLGGVPGAQFATNSWPVGSAYPTAVTSAAAGDFITLDTAGVRGPRKADGNLPDITFMHLAPGSQFIDAGTDVGLPFTGLKPDLGCFEQSGPADVPMDLAGKISGFQLSQNYPNPFNPSTHISYQIAKSGLVTLKVFDVLGREVAVLVHEVKSSGKFTVDWNAAGLPSGLYFSRCESENTQQTIKMILMK